MTCWAVVFSHPTKRAESCARTLRLLTERSDVAVPPPVVWTGQGANDVDDFRALIAAPFLERGDLLFLEDDVEPCRNALPFMMRWPSLYLTSFYNPGRPYGLTEGFIFSQAFKLPELLVQRMRTEPFPPPHPKQRDAVDQVVHRYLTRWRLKFYQHRSLVEHRGEISTWTKSSLKGSGRRSIDWPGPDYDAFQGRQTDTPAQ